MRPRLTIHLPPVSALVGSSDNPPGRAGEHHAVVNQAQNLDDAVGPQAVDDKVARCGDTACRLDAAATQPGRVGADTTQAGQRDRAEHVRLLADRGHHGQD